MSTLPLPTDKAGARLAQSDDVRILKSLKQYIWPRKENDVDGIRTRVTASLFLLAAGKVLTVSVPFFFKMVVDSLNDSAALSISATNLDVFQVAGTVLMGYGVARLTSVLFGEMRNAIFGSVTQKAIRSAARNIFFHLLQLDSGFHLARQTGGLVRAIDRGTKGINQVLSSIVFHIAPTLFEILIVCSILSHNYGVSYAITTITTMASYTAYTILTTQWRLPFRKQMNQADNQAASTATDSLLNVEAVQQFTNEALEAQKYDTSLKVYEVAAIKSATSLAILNAGQSAIFSVALTAMMWMAAQGVLQGTMSVGDLVMINGLVFQLAMPLNFLGSVYRETRQSLIDMKAMFDMSLVASKITQSKGLPGLPSFLSQTAAPEIVFDGVVFGYEPSRSILRGISFTIPAGKRVAFVGPSGCGKSTILRLITRFHDPQTGSIRVGGVDTREVDVTCLRENMGVVPQDSVLFNTTLRENIGYGRPAASMLEIKKAAEMAELLDSVEKFSHKWETRVGERGLMISGGEKQRVQLARMFLKNAPIALFDEPTSALDQSTETRIMKTIFTWLKSNHASDTKGKGAHGPTKTAVFIAHRLATIADCDLIYVLKEGQVAESGTHEDLLLKENGVYAGMWKAQSRT